MDAKKEDDLIEILRSIAKSLRNIETAAKIIAGKNPSP